MEKDGIKYYYHADGLGSITYLTDANQAVVESYTYNVFGKQTRYGNTVKNRYTFTAREWDQEVGLYYYRARYYDANVGRFITQDPIGFNGGINFYPYVKNNPVNWIDPSGLIWITIGYKYHWKKDVPLWFLNRVTQQIGRGMNPTVPGADPKEYLGLRRDVIQVWQHDPNYPCRDKEHSIGEKRTTLQTYKKLFKNYKEPNLYNDNDEYFYYEWDPVVKSPTY